MTVRVHMPPLLRHAMGGERWLEADGASVAVVLRNLARARPALALHLFDEHGQVRHNIVCVHGSTVVRAREMASHAVQPDDELVLANALAGG